MSSYFFALSVALLRNIREIWQVSSSERDLALSWHQAGGSADLCHFRHKKQIIYVYCAVSSWMSFCICAVYSHACDFLRSIYTFRILFSNSLGLSTSLNLPGQLVSPVMLTANTCWCDTQPWCPKNFKLKLAEKHQITIL